MSARITSDRVSLTEEARFANTPVEYRGALTWDVTDLWDQTLAGLQRAAGHAHDAGESPRSIAVDSWGVDFGLVTSDGLLADRVGHYRSASPAAIDRTDDVVSRAELFRRTGVTPMAINTAFRVADAVAMVDAGRPELTLLLVPDLWTFWLAGQRAAELTIAATTGLLDVATRVWDSELLTRLGIDERLLPPVAATRSPAGRVLPAIAQRIGCSADVAVVRTAAHDTAAAIAAIPGRGTIAFISCGTWALVGVEIDRAVLSEDAFRAGFTNEVGANGQTLFMRNLSGLWLLEQVLGAWRATDATLSLRSLLTQAATLTEFGSTIDVGAPSLGHSVDVEADIRRMCRDTGQRLPVTAPEVVRCIMSSLAAAFHATLLDCVRLAGVAIDEIHMVGGGTRNELLCQLVADTCERPLVVGPTEATSLGNALVQAWACGEVTSAAHIRRLVEGSFPSRRYLPNAQPPKPRT